MKFVNEVEIDENCITEIVERMKTKNEDFEDAFECVIDSATKTQKEYDCVLGVKKQIEKEVMKRLKGQKKRVFYTVTQRYEMTVPALLMSGELKDYLTKMHKKGNPGEMDSEFIFISVVDEEV